jgi:hypothetical protein
MQASPIVIQHIDLDEYPVTDPHHRAIEFTRNENDLMIHLIAGKRNIQPMILSNSDEHRYYLSSYFRRFGFNLPIVWDAIWHLLHGDETPEVWNPFPILPDDPALPMPERIIRAIHRLSGSVFDIYALEWHHGYDTTSNAIAEDLHISQEELEPMIHQLLQDVTIYRLAPDVYECYQN